MVLVMIPFILLGVYEKIGEPLEVVLKHFFIPASFSIIAPLNPL